MPNPRIEQVQIGNLTVLDPSDCTKAQRIAAANKYEFGKELWIRDTDNPGFTQEDFCIQAPEGSHHDGELIPDRPAMLMFVLKDGIGHGVLSISNMIFETDTPRKIEAVGAGIYISHPEDTQEMLHESAVVCDFFLDNDITLKDGRILDVVEWDLNWPPGLRTDKIINLGPWFDVAKTVGLRYPALEGDDVIPIRMRRSDAPRQVPGDVFAERDSRRPPRPTLPAAAGNAP